MNSIDKLKLMREKLAAQSGEKGGGGMGDGAAFPFWNVKVGSTVGLRFLPDKNQNNPFLWVEKQTFKWSFPDARNPQLRVEVNLPCKEMYDGPKSCQIVNELRQFYKTGREEDAAIAKPFWPKKVYVYQGFVRNSSIQEDNVPENPIRIFMINKKVHTKIKESILSNDEQTAFKISPDDYHKGRDFVIKKTKQGKFDNYDQSQWAFSETSLTDDEFAAIEKFGLWDLSSRLPKRPSDEAFDVMHQILHAGLTGEPWNPAWDVHFKPRQVSGSSYASDGGAEDDVDEQPRPQTFNRAPSNSDAISKLRAAPPVRHVVEDDEPVIQAPPQPRQPVPQATKPSADNGKDVLERLKSLRAKAAN